MKLGYLILCLLTIAVTFREAFSQPSLICAHAEEYLPPDHICRVVFPNNTLIMVPNPHQTLQYKRTFPTHRAGLQALVGESISQANDYINLLSQPTNCSDNIYFLVCLYYFPTCTVRNDGAVVPAYPCLHVCEEVNERCSERLKKAPGKQFTNCSSTYYDAEVVHGVPELPVFVPKSTDRRVCSSPLTPTTDPSPETAAKPTSSVTTAQPCPDYHSELPKGWYKTHLCIVTFSLNSGFYSSFLYGAGIEDATIRCRARRSKFSDILSKSQLKRYKSTYGTSHIKCFKFASFSLLSIELLLMMRVYLTSGCVSSHD